MAKTKIDWKETGMGLLTVATGTMVGLYVYSMIPKAWSKVKSAMTPAPAAPPETKEGE